MTANQEAPAALSPERTATGAVRDEGKTGGGPLAMFGRLFERSVLHLVLIGIVILWSIPTLALLISSFREPAAIASTGWWTALTGSWNFTLDNYDQVLSQRNVGRAFLNSLIISVPATLLSILVAAMAAYAFAWMRFPGRNALFLVVVGLLVVPLQMTLIPVLRILGNVTIETEMPLIGGNLFGINSFTSMWLAHTAYGLPFAVFLLRNFFAALPRELFESAYLDGASDARVFFRIVLPLSGPAIAALAIFQFLWVWNDLLIALIYLGDPELAPMTLTIRNLVSSFGTQYQLLTAAAFVSMALPLLIFFALQRYFVQGVLAGSVKG
ncbi:MAG: ABC transporter permease subunit [Dehalococcoidia bacterium]|nr:ABC transporter permease subunit [Dehalococcoidia bacterium]